MLKSLRATALPAIASMIGLSLAAHASPAAAQTNPGEALYKQHCAACHDQPEVTRSPSKATLGAMRFQALDFALTQGKMKAQGASLNDEQRGVLINYLTGKTAATGDDWTAKMMCPAGGRPIDLSSPTITGFGYDRANSRKLTAKQAGLTKGQLTGGMDVAWSIAIPGATTMRSQPAVVGKTVFLPVADAAALYAFDVSNPAKPCIKWLYKTPGGAPLRTSASYGVLANGQGVLAFSGVDTTVYLLDAKSGKPIWTKKTGTYAWSITTGTPTVTKDRIIVPVAQYEISVAGDNKEKCCDNHGYVLSLSPKDGSQQWRYDTMPDAKPLRDRGDGKMLYGPSGAPIWNSPSVDEKRGLIYFGTGEANSPPAHINTDALIAIGLADGKEKWAMQATSRDIYTSGCGPTPRKEQLNCVSDTVFRDADFGGSSLLAKLSHGTEIMVSGQKSGTVWALEPTTGKLLWRTHLGTGGALGGVHWGIAYDKDTIFAPVSAVGRNLAGEPVDVATIKSGLYALDAATGAVKWNYAAVADCTGDRSKRLPACQRAIGFSTAPTVIDGVVITGALDGYLYAFDAGTGKLLWKYDTAQSYTGINGVDGKGGAIDAASITAANGLLIVNSGYGMFGQQAGNMIIALKPKAR